MYKHFLLRFGFIIFLLSTPFIASAVVARTYTPVIEKTTATLEGYAKPDNSSLVWFEYGEGSKLVNATGRKRVGSAGQVSIRIGVLEPNTKYSYKLFLLDVTNGRLITSNITSFTTKFDPADQFARKNNLSTNPVVVETYTASSISNESALLRGVINPKDAKNAKVWFQWGASKSFGNKTVSESVYQTDVFSSYVVNLEPNTTYYYQIVGSNDFGIEYGDIHSFQTSPKVQEVDAVGVGSSIVVSSSIASPDIFENSVVVHGAVLPSNTNIKVWYRWGLRADMMEYVGDVHEYNGGLYYVVDERIGGLNADTTYYYQMMAQNNTEVVRGVVMSVHTRPVSGGGGYIPLENTQPTTVESVSVESSVTPETTQESTSLFADDPSTGVNLGAVALGGSLSQEFFSFNDSDNFVRGLNVLDKVYTPNIFSTGIMRIFPHTFWGWFITLIVIYILLSMVISRKAKKERKEKGLIDDTELEEQSFIKKHGIV